MNKKIDRMEEQMTIQEQFAYEVAESINAKVLKERCSRIIAHGIVCQWPLLQKEHQEFPFCWGCATDQRTAEEGRALLLRCKFKQDGAVITPESAWRHTASL